MSYQANVDIVIALNTLQISSFRKQGYLRFKVTLAHRLKKVNELSATKIEDDSFCSPYNIYKQPKQSPLIVRDLRKVHTLSGNKMNLQYLHQYEKQQQQSYIDHEQECYYSKVMQSKFQSQLHKIEECCYFRKYIDTQDIQHSCFVLKVELLFRPHADQNYIQAGFYEAVIHRISGFSAYLPVEFDQLGGFAISALYHAIVMEYKFEGQDGKQQYNSFEDYLVAATKGIHYDQFMNFYNYYRGSLESQLGMIQERHAQLLNVLRINTQFSITRVNQNQVILNLTTFLNNSHQTHQHHSLKYNQQLRERLCEEITKDFVFIKALIHQKWNQFIIFVCTNISALTQYYKGNYDIHVKDRFKTHVFSHKIQPKWDWTYSRYEDSGKELLLQAEMDKMKHKEEELWREQFPIEGTHLFSQQKKTIKIFEEVYQVRGALLTQRSLSPTASHRSNIQPNRFSTMQQGRSYSPRSYEFQPHFHSAKEISEFSPFKLHRPPLQVFPNFQSKEHVVIFVHGFQASRQDFVLFKSCLEILYGCRVFISSTNEGRTQESIEILGKHLAVELNQLFKTIEFTPNTRISFVGHSMGGIIIRSALSYIKNLQPYLYSYLSFSSPHLGYMYQPSKLIKAGLWLLNAFQNVKSLQELCMKDNHDPRRSLLYRLSENNSLHGFKKLALISSSQDQYVPYESARVQKNQKLMHQLGYLSSTIVKEMVDNLLGQICATEISRMNVVFNIEDKNFDSIVGRTAHIKYLSDQKFIKMFSIVFQKYFA